MNKLDSDLLRTFLAVAEAGSMTEGASLIGRTQSATSIQIKRLEDILGQPVFERHGRGVGLSEAGHRLMKVARDVTGQLDNALRDITNNTLQGKLRLGIPDDQGKEKLTQIIASFARQYPEVELDVTCAMSAGFAKAISKGQLDLAVYEVEEPAPGEEVIFEDPTCWVTSVHCDFSNITPVPVALFDADCWWRDAAIKSVEQSGKPYRIVYSSHSASGVIAAVEAGIAIGLLGRASIHKGLAVVGPEFKFGPTPTSKLVVSENRKHSRELLSAMKSAIRSAFSVSTAMPDAKQAS